MKIYALVLCAMLAFGAGVSVPAQEAPRPQAAAGASNVQALGNVQAVDERTLSLDAAATAAPTAPAAGPNTLVYFLRMILVLALVVGAMYAVFTVMRRLAKPKDRGDSPIRVLASTPLGAGKSVHLLGLGSKAWLVGSSEHAVSLIAEVDDKELLDGLELEAATEKPHGGGDFAALLGSLLSKGRGARGSARPQARREALGPESSADFISRQRSRLERYNGEEP